MSDTEKWEDTTNRLVRIETKLDALTDHETRLRRLESLVWRAAGAASAFGVVGGVIMTRVMHAG